MKVERGPPSTEWTGSNKEALAVQVRGEGMQNRSPDSKARAATQGGQAGRSSCD